MTDTPTAQGIPHLDPRTPVADRKIRPTTSLSTDLGDSIRDQGVPQSDIGQPMARLGRCAASGQNRRPGDASAREV